MQELTREQLLEKIAPCSLMCYTCEAYKQGVICESVKNLLQYTEGISKFYDKYRPSEVEKYNELKKILEGHTEGVCCGCRDKEHNGCSIEGCFINDCTKEHNVDYCGECPKFPCNKTKPLFEVEVYLQWLVNNTKIKVLGIEEFWKEYGVKSHYKFYEDLER